MPETATTITATAEEHGRKIWYFVYEDGELRRGYPMKSTRTYTHVHVQRWAPVGSPGEFGAPEQWAARFTATPKKLGAKIEYGYVSEVVPITGLS